MILNFIASNFNIVFFNKIIILCATCFGDPQADTTKALNYAIFSLMGATGIVFSLLISFFFFVIKKRKNNSGD